MTHNKSLLKTALISTMLLCGAVSCSDPKPEMGPVNFQVPEEGFNTSQDVTIKFYTTMGQDLQNVFNLYLEDFNALYPNIHVDAQFIGGYDDVRDQMNTEIASGKSDVNVAYCYPDHIATYNTAKSVITLDNLIDDPTYGFSDAEVFDFVKAYYEEGSSLGDGKMYSLPFSKSSEVLYYNKTVFEKHDLTAPTHWFSENENDKTSMEYVCGALKALYPDSIPLGYDSDSNWFITMCAQNNIPYTAATGNNYLFNNDSAKEFVGTFKNWFDKGWLTTKSLYGGYTSTLFTTTDKQNSFMTIGSSAGASHQSPSDGRFEVDIVPVPQCNEDNKAVIQQGPNVCIFNNTDPQKIMASWLFVKFFTTNVEFQAQFSMTSGYTPVIKSVFENDTYKEFLNDKTNIQALSTKVCVEQEANYFTSPAFDGSSMARDQVGTIINRVFKGEDINTVFADAVANCQK
ncbi:MAG: extracellular solute-binding protein [Erysipelotrichaceae bacterium]|nr:extracellular solute-binding protein [Erysipelotrichaceae bacterium]